MEFVNGSTESYWTSCFQKRFNLLPDSNMCSSTTEPRYIQGLRLLDREIEFISGLVQSQKARRNTISPISRLPPEVLVLIFKACRDDDTNALGDRDQGALARLSEACKRCRVYYSSTYHTELPEHLGWIECSRVCQRWRHIIFGTPSLWSDIIVEWGPLWLQQFLKYSQSASKIRFLGYLGWPCTVSASALELDSPKLSASDLSRADKISLGGIKQSTLTTFLRGFRFSSTSLKTIELTVTTSLERYFLSWDDAVPLGLLLHNFPALERISLRDCLVNWEPPPLPSHSLKFMEVVMGSRDMDGRDYTESFNAEGASEFLRSTPSVEILTLIYCFPRRYHQDTGTDKIIELPCLRELDLEEGDRSWCPYFLGRLKLPSESMSRVRLWSQSDFGSSKNYDPIRSHLQRRFHDVDVSSGYLEFLHVSNAEKMHWKVHTHVISSEAPSSSVEAPIQSDPGTERHTDLCIQELWSDANRFMRAFYEACGSLPLLFVRVLVIERADARSWAILAERFPSITSITCLSDRAILHSPRDGSTILSTALVRAFPKLAFLKLGGIRLQLRVDARAGEEVLELLRMRKEAGVPVQRLVLERCHPCSAWLVAARGVVEHVEVVECQGKCWCV